MSEAVEVHEQGPEPVVWHRDEDAEEARIADYLASGELVVRNTYAQIEGELKMLREEKELIQARINELVEAEQLWRPLIHRLDNGIQRRSASE